MNTVKGVIEYRFKKEGDKKERNCTIRYNNFFQMVIAYVKVNLKRPDIIINHKNA